LFSIDDFYSIPEYNTIVQSTKNNNVEIREFIHIRNFSRAIEGPEPVYINYEKVKETLYVPLVQIDDFSLEQKYKRGQYPGKTIIPYIYPLRLHKIHQNDIVVIKVKNPERARKLSNKNAALRLWGTLPKRKYHIFVCFDLSIIDDLTVDELVVHYTKEAQPKRPGELEADLRRLVFKENMEKYMRSIVYENGRIRVPKI